MTFTYTGSPSNDSTQGQLDALRLMLNQTSSSGPASVVLQDEELAFYLTEAGGMYAAAAQAADQISSRYAGLVTSKRVGELSLTYSDRAAEYRSLSLGFRRQVALRAVPYAGGISVADKAMQVADRDRVRPEFRRDMDDNPREGGGIWSSTGGPNG